MPTPKKFPLSFNGIAGDGNKIYVSAMFDDSESGGIYSFSDDIWKGTKLKTTCIDVAFGGTPIILCGSRQVGRFEKGAMKFTLVKSKKNDSDFIGPPSEIRVVENTAYVVGMDMIYDSKDFKNWRRLDTGIREDSQFPTEFNSIHGFASDNLYAAGHDGAIAFFDGTKWQKVDSPTNVILTRVLCCKNGFVYICGRDGILLKGLGHEWQVINTGIDSAIWDIAWFGNKLILATRNSLFSYDHDQFTPIDFSNSNLKISGKGSQPFGHLFSDNRRLWSAGPKMITYTDDGDKWHETNYDLPGI